MFAALPPTPTLRSRPARGTREPEWPRPQASDPFVSLVRSHHQVVFHLVHAVLRDEEIAEKVTRQVFARARRRFGPTLGSEAPECVEWLYQAALRFVRMYHWRSVGLFARRRMHAFLPGVGGALPTHLIVRVIAHRPGEIPPRDCELLVLRHVLGMPLANIAQLLRMHPYEVSNRLVWTQERVSHLGRLMAGDEATPRLVA